MCSIKVRLPVLMLVYHSICYACEQHMGFWYLPHPRSLALPTEDCVDVLSTKFSVFVNILFPKSVQYLSYQNCNGR